MDRSAFQEWIETELHQRQWSARHASLQAGLSPNTVAQYLNGKQPGLRACLALSALFRRPYTEVLVMAGHLQPPAHSHPTRQAVNAILDDLPPAQLEQALIYVRMLAQQS